MLGYPQIIIESGAGLEKDPKEDLARELRGGDENGLLKSSHQPDPIHVLDVERRDSEGVRSNMTAKKVPK